MDKQPYTQPHLETIGSVTDLTRAGDSNPGDDNVRGLVFGGSAGPGT